MTSTTKKKTTNPNSTGVVTLQSMTAFARTTEDTDWGHAVWEIRSLNHRHLDIQCRLPESLGYLEPMLRSRLPGKINRGRIEIRLYYQPADNTLNSLHINQDLLAQLLNCYIKINEHSGCYLPPDAMRLLAWPGLLQTHRPCELQGQVTDALLSLFDKTLATLLVMRQTEGQAIRHYLKKRLDLLDQHLSVITAQLPEIRNTQQEKLRARFVAAQLGAHIQRFEQELVLSLQKLDVSEELDRLTIHLNACRTILQNAQGAGRQLDCFMQELSREANTLASKSINAAMSLRIVDIKVLLEEMREQVQNVE